MLAPSSIERREAAGAARWRLYRSYTVHTLLDMHGDGLSVIPSVFTNGKFLPAPKTHGFYIDPDDTLQETMETP